MRPLLVLVVVLAGYAARGKPSEPVARPILFDDLGTHHHPLTTRSPEAQRLFDQGLRLVWERAWARADVQLAESRF